MMEYCESKIKRERLEVLNSKVQGERGVIFGTIDSHLVVVNS